MCTWDIIRNFHGRRLHSTSFFFPTRKLDLNWRKKPVKRYIWSIALCDAETCTLRKLDQKYLVPATNVLCTPRVHSYPPHVMPLRLCTSYISIVYTVNREWYVEISTPTPPILIHMNPLNLCETWRWPLLAETCSFTIEYNIFIASCVVWLHHPSY